MKVFCCLLASQRCKVVPAFMHFSAFVFFLQKWNDIGVCCSFCEKRIKDCDLFCCLFTRGECCLELSHFVLFVKQKATKNEIQFFPLNQQVKKGTKCCLFRAGEMLLQLSQSFPINKKKRTQTFIHHFFLRNNNICREWLKDSLTHKCNVGFSAIKNPAPMTR